MNTRRICLLFLMLVAGGPRLTFAQPPVILTDAQDEYPLGVFLEYLEDPTGVLTIDDITSPESNVRFVRSQIPVPKFGFTTSVYWVRVRLRNLAHQTPEWRLELGFANMQHIELYRPRANSSSSERNREIDVIRTGTHYPFATRDYSYHRFVFKLFLPLETDQTIYLRFQSETSMTLPLTLWSPDTFQRYIQRELLLSGLFYGALLLLLVYNAFLWLALRDRAYGYYVGFMISALLGQFIYEGLAGQYLWPNAPRLTDTVFLLALTGVIISNQMFTITFLDTRTRVPRGHRVIIVFLTIWGLIVALIPFVSYGRLIRVVLPLRIVHSLFFTGINFFIWRRGYQPARYVFLAWIATAPTNLLVNLSRLGVIPSSGVTEHGYQVGVVLTGVLLSFALADRIRLLRQEKDAAQSQVLAALQDKERMIREHNLLLEQNINARTLELQQEVQAHQQTEAQLQRAKEQAEEANQAKSLFLSNMSHELRTPLNAILGYAQLLKQGKSPETMEYTGLETIEHCGQHLVQLIEDLLDLAKIETRKINLIPGAFSLSACLATIANMVRLRASQKGVAFECALPPDLPAIVFGDEKRLSQVLLNVLGNAIKFTEQGRVTLRVSLIDNCQLTIANCQLRFEVEDTGPGIPADQLEHIFTPLVQIKEIGQNSEGIGLGLSISRTLVRLMGDDLHVTSTVGLGSTFWFTLALPEVAAPQGLSSATTCPIIGIQGHPPHILIVDDHADNRAMLRHSLQSLGFVISEAKNGQEGFEQAECERPDLIVMDLMMPVLDGFEATRRIRKSPTLTAVKIIVMTADLTINADELMREIGCDDVLTKPVRLDHLVDRLRAHLGIEWIYDTMTPSAASEPLAMVRPPAADLSNLRQLAGVCAFTELMDELSRLRQKDQQYEPFVNSLLPLLNTFQFEALRERLNSG